MIDKEVIEGRIDIITENLRYLRRTAQMELNDFASNFEKIQATKHSLQEAIEACLDTANHIMAGEGFPRAEQYSEFFTTLGQKKVIDPALAERLSEMAKFRNLLVHRYTELDSRKLHELLNNNLDDIEEYVKQILEYVNKKHY